MKNVKQHSLFLKLFFRIYVLLMFFTFSLYAQQADLDNGKELFNTHCVECHKLDGTLIGPALRGISEKYSNEWLQSFIKDNQALRASGDADANAIFNQYNELPMQAFPMLSEKDINDILAYTDERLENNVNQDITLEDNEPTEEARKGRTLFNANCASCHRMDKDVIGPALGNVAERRSNEWLQAWIKDNAALRASGDTDAKEIFDQYNGSPMTAFPQLSKEDIDDIIAYTTEYVKFTSSKKVAIEDTIEKSKRNWQSYVVAIVLLIFIIWVFSRNKNGFIKFVTVIGLLIGFAWFGFGFLWQIGVDKGYQPIQPIAFSHKIHAGDNKIDCQYCHSASRHSKTAGIPSVNICMNCHMNITEYNGPVTKEHDKEFYDAEIQKIYEAIGWDSDEYKYIEGYDQRPIEWVRIHNLPDFAYFNHSQHVNVAGISCQKCHGPVEVMEEVYQFSPLTMGWCIDCHRSTEIDLDNGYYKKIHEELAKKYGVVKVTEAQIGGLECGKCHY